MPGPALVVGVVAAVAIGVLAISIYATQDQYQSHSQYHHEWHGHSRRQRQGQRHGWRDSRDGREDNEEGRATGTDLTETFVGGDTRRRRRGTARGGDGHVQTASTYELDNLATESELADLEESNYQAAVRASLVDLSLPHEHDTFAAENTSTEYLTPEYMTEKPASSSVSGEAPSSNSLDDPFADPVVVKDNTVAEDDDWTDPFTDSDTDSDKHSEKSYL